MSSGEVSGLRSRARSVVRVVAEAVLLFGYCWVACPPPPVPMQVVVPAGEGGGRELPDPSEPGARPEPPRTPPPGGPGPLHPERLCPEAPLTPLERRLLRELGGSGARLGRRLSR